MGTNAKRQRWIILRFYCDILALATRLWWYEIIEGE